MTKRQEIINRAKEIIKRETAAVQAVQKQFDENLIKVAEILLNAEGHVLITGTGTSRFVAQRFSHLLCCCGVPSLFINAADSLHGGAGAVTDKDIVFIISKGGQSSEINLFAEIAKSRGATLIALSEKNDSPLASIVDVVLKIVTVGEVDPFGMIATGSSLVNCAVCDVICVLLLEQTGYSKDQFGATHPAGAVGRKTMQENQ